MTHREILSISELANLLTAELQKFDGCEECIVSAVYTLKIPDEEGCNWSVSRIRATDVPQEIWEPAMEEIVSAARTKYNVR